MEPQFRFCTSADGTRIAYANLGEGPALVQVPAWAGNLEYEWEHPDSHAFLGRLTEAIMKKVALMVLALAFLMLGAVACAGDNNGALDQHPQTPLDVGSVETPARLATVIGTPTVTPTASPTPSSAPRLSLPVDAAVLGENHTCVLTTAGGIKCWGSNNVGQLGDGTEVDSVTPVDAVGLSGGVAAVSAGHAHTCAVTTAGGIKCWGSNSDGQLGDGTKTSSTTPVDVMGLSDGVAAVIAGAAHTCAVTTAGGIKCWGSNSDGRLGDGTKTSSTTPVDVMGLSDGVATVIAGRRHTCALTTAGGIKCWGSNSDGQLGDGRMTPSSVPVEVVGLESGVVAVGTGDAHTCAITTAGGVKCWGWNSAGQLGDGRTIVSRVPVEVVGLESGAAAVTAGYRHACALTTAGGVKCWGLNVAGQLGDGTKTSSTTPVDVIGLSDGAAAVIAGAARTCAVTTAGDMKCWGSNNAGQLGDGTTTDSSVPVWVAGPGP